MLSSNNLLVNKIGIFLLSLLVISCGGGGAKTPPAVTVSLKASPDEVLVTTTTTLTWASSNATECIASGAWVGAKALFGSETITIAETGDSTYRLNCTGKGQPGSASEVIVGFKNTQGVVADVSGAAVFVDLDGDWMQGSSEYSSISDEDGKFTIRHTNKNLISIGGVDRVSLIDLDELLLFHKLTEYTESVVVTPVTSIAGYMDDPSLVNSALGIDDSIDVATFDPVANRGDEGINDYLYEKGSQLTVLALALQNISNGLNSTSDTSEDYFKAIAEEIASAYEASPSKVDIETQTFIRNVLDRVIAAKLLTVTDQGIIDSSLSLSGVLTIIDGRMSVELTTALARFSLGTLQSDIRALIDGTASVEKIDGYTSNILTFIGSEQDLVANNLTPDVIAGDDSGSTLEDNAVAIDILSNDTFLSNAPYTIELTSGANGATSINDRLVTYTPNLDFNGTDSFSYTIAQGGKSATGTVSVTIEAVNDAPIIGTTDFTINENETAVARITVSDVDVQDTLSLTLDLESADAGLFSLTDERELSFKVAPDYDVDARTYSFTVTVTDGTEDVQKTVTVNVTDVDEPPVFVPSGPFSAQENQLDIGSISASDPEGGAIVYSLGGDDAASLVISADGIISFANAPNYEIKTTYSAAVNAYDGLNTTIQTITIQITDVNDAPVATSGSYDLNLMPQSQTSKTLTLSASDEDGDTLTYMLVSNGSYGIASLSGNTITYQTSSSTQSSQSESFSFKVNDGEVDSLEASISIDLRTDPLYKYQWHLNNTGQTNFATTGGTAGADIDVDSAVISGITGSGVTVAVLDEGLELAHEDLSDNIVNGSWDFANSDEDPTRSANDGDHGTSVGGIIASKGWNKKGGRGVAPDASLIGYNIIEDGASYQSNLVMAYGVNRPIMVDVDVHNMSYGLQYGTDDNGDPNVTYNLRSYDIGIKHDALKSGTETLRNGKGALYVKSSGNDFFTASTSGGDCGTDFACTETIIDPSRSLPYIINVAALDANGIKTSYSTPGASVWVSGFGGESGVTNPAIMTTDQSGCASGYVGVNSSRTSVRNAFENNSGDHPENLDCNYTSGFNGTSSAAPTVSGVVALMLEANPDLTWRDVKHILASTSDQVDSSRSYDYRGVTQYEWETNSAGYKFHNWYGFGKVDAAEAVSTAAAYTDYREGALKTPGYISSGNISASINDSGIDTSSSVSITAPDGSNDSVEFVRVFVKFSHSVPKSVGLRLMSPDGTVINAMQPMTNVGSTSSGTFFAIGVNSFYGESMEGTWTIVANDYIADGTSGILTEWGITIYGN
ncbi:S8 family serine peptidase [Porticoccaceae bacterium]|nr:S8 family serine peptidase [Porticoccaceae bacterium]MDA8978516.1 S8 family serine peptidase [bacterium]